MSGFSLLLPLVLFAAAAAIGAESGYSLTNPEQAGGAMDVDADQLANPVLRLIGLSQNSAGPDVGDRG